MSSITYTDFQVLNAVLSKKAVKNMKGHFFFAHETPALMAHATVTKSNEVYDYILHMPYSSLTEWAMTVLSVLPRVKTPFLKLRFGTQECSLTLDEIATVLGYPKEESLFEYAAAEAVPKTPAAGSAGVGAAAASAAAPPASALPTPGPFKLIENVLAFTIQQKNKPAAAAAPAETFTPPSSAKARAILHKIANGETLTEEESAFDLFAPEEENEEEDLAKAKAMATHRVEAEAATKEAERLLEHLLSLTRGDSVSAGVVQSILKAYHAQKEREFIAAMRLSNAYLEHRQFFAPAPNVLKMIDKELGRYAFIAKAILEEGM
jgi:hypothetical protein